MGWMDELADDSSLVESENQLWDVTARFNRIKQSVMGFETLKFMETLRKWGECNQQMRLAHNEYAVSMKASEGLGKIPDQKYLLQLQSMMLSLQVQKEQLQQLSVDAKLQLEYIRKKEEYRRLQMEGDPSAVLYNLAVLQELEDVVNDITSIFEDDSDKKTEPRNPLFYEPPALAEGMREQKEMTRYLDLYESVKKPPEDAPKELRIAYRNQANAMNNIMHYLTLDDEGKTRKISSWEAADLKSCYGSILESSVKALQALSIEESKNPGKYADYVKEMKSFIDVIRNDMKALDSYNLDGSKTLEEIILNHREHPEEKGPDSKPYLAALIGIHDDEKHDDRKQEDSSQEDITEELNSPEGKKAFMNRKLLNYIFDTAEGKTDQLGNPPSVPAYLDETAGWHIIGLNKTAFLESMTDKMGSQEKAERAWECIEGLQNRIVRGITDRGILEGKNKDVISNAEKDGTILVKVSELGGLKIKAGEIRPVKQRTLTASEEKHIRNELNRVQPRKMEKPVKKKENPSKEPEIKLKNKLKKKFEK